MSESENETLKRENARLVLQNEQLLHDVQRLESARKTLAREVGMLSSENEMLKSMMGGGAVGERGEACMSVDCGNL